MEKLSPKAARILEYLSDRAGDGVPPSVREICAALGADALRLRYTIVSGKGAYFQNVYRLAAFSETEIVVRSRRETFLVSGAALSLGKYEAGDLVIFGDIVRVERQGVQV